VGKLLTFLVNNLTKKEYLDILFKERKLRNASNNFRKLVQLCGEKRAKLVARRLNELRAADNLAALHSLPHIQFHKLKGDRGDRYSVELDWPFRLTFIPCQNSEPIKKFQESQITQIMIHSIEDTHGTRAKK